MPTNYDGKPDSATAYPALSILSSSNTNPCVVTVSGSLPASFYTAGLGGTAAAPKVHIKDHIVNPQINGIWTATPTGASTFTIPVAGTSIAGGTGTVQPLGLSPVYAVPSDGDSDNQASITPWAEATGDRSQAIAALGVGQFKLARREIIFTASGLAVPQPPWAVWAAGGLTAGTPEQFTSDPVTWTTAIGAAIATPTSGQPPVFAITGVVAGDLVMARLSTTFQSPAQHALALYSAIVSTPTIPTWPTDYAHMFGASAAANAAVTGNQGTTPITIEGLRLAGSSGNIWIQPILFPLTNGSSALALQGDACLVIDILRGTGFAQ